MESAKDQIFVVLTAVFVIYVSYSIYQESDYFQLKCVISDVDKNTYCVRERKRVKEASDLLAQTATNLERLVAVMSQKAPDDPMVTRISKRFDARKIKEILPTSEYTAYSENKGEKLALCLNEKKEDAESRLIDPNTLMYVAMHELAHVGTVSIGHDSEFWANFKRIIEFAAEADLYRPIDYKKNNASYCGMKLTDNPYFDA